MPNKIVPNTFKLLLENGCIEESDVIKTGDNFFLIYKSLSDILAVRDIHDFPDTDGKRLICKRFFDDWFLYAVPNENDYTYGLLKLREQEHDAKDESPADGDTPGVTISFISFDVGVLLNCLTLPDDENRKKLNSEINRVVARRGQSHHKALKRYFKNPRSEGAYLVASVYVRHIASFSENGYLNVPDYYKELVSQSIGGKNKKSARLPSFIEKLNRSAGSVVCDNERIRIENTESLTAYEAYAILATHTGNTSIFSFAAEVEYHAKYLILLAKIKIPFMGKSVYDSAIRADMTVGDTEFEGPAPFYRDDSKIVKRQRELHPDETFPREAVK